MAWNWLLCFARIFKFSQYFRYGLLKYFIYFQVKEEAQPQNCNHHQKGDTQRQPQLYVSCPNGLTLCYNANASKNGLWRHYTTTLAAVRYARSRSVSMATPAFRGLGRFGATLNRMTMSLTKRSWSDQINSIFHSQNAPLLRALGVCKCFTHSTIRLKINIWFSFSCLFVCKLIFLRFPA